MVPRKLRLRNFMAYRAMSQPIDFTGIHIACLTGANGAGKSTLLDAITWAVWGRSRAKSDDDLVALGESEMEVEFEFSLGEEIYRVLRKRSKPGVRKSGHSMLDLFVAGGADGDDATFVPITGNTMRETDRKIQSLLRLDYDTFVNSALLLQGRADEFTTKRPDLRKQVLADVLGLSRYDRYAEAAREEARQRDAKHHAAATEIRSLEQQVQQRPDFAAELAGALAAKSAIDALVTAQDQRVQALLEAQRLRHERAALLEGVQERVQRTVKDLADLDLQQQRLTKRRDDAQLLLAQRDTLLQAVAEHQEAQAIEEQLAQAGQRSMQLRTQQSQLQQALDHARSELVAQERVLQRDLAQLQSLAEERPALAVTVQQATDRLATLTEREQALASLRVRSGEFGQDIGRLQALLQEITRQGRETKARQDQLQQAGAEGICPLCGTELGTHGQGRILGEYDAELKRQREAYRSNDRTLQELVLQQKQVDEEAARTDAEIVRDRTDAQHTLITASNRLKDAEAAAMVLDDTGTKLQMVQQQLADGSFAPEAAELLAAAQDSLAALDYDEAAHRTVRERLRALAAAVGSAQRLPEAERALTEAQQDLAQLADTRTRRQTELATDQESLLRLQADLAAAPDVDATLTKAQRELEDSRRRSADLSGSIGRLQGDIERCDRLQEMLDERRKSALIWVQEKALYDELNLAFGRRGIQALLIETALPELEDEANALLGRMTDNRLTLKLETQRQGRGGNTIETLDIKIADELGTRPYELYSGGEAFRINFALRIALSKLLARRAGAPLPTLIMDEGFGTQDAAGREKLVEAVNAIAEEFQCVLIITHVDELKEVFPARIEVTKNFNGSQAVVIRA